MSFHFNLLDLAWFIPLFPLLAFVSIALHAHRDQRLSHSLAIGSLIVALLLAQIVFWRAVTLPVGGGGQAYESANVPWLVAGEGRLTLGVYVDPVTAVMLFTVPLVCLLIFIYSVGYMHFAPPRIAPRYSRFFAYLSLFAAGMLGMVVFNNLLVFFIFWEIAGACAYLLIGCWHDEAHPDPDGITPRAAGLKAFIVTRIGDLCFLLGLVLLYAEAGSLAYQDVFTAETLSHLAKTPFMGTSASMATVITLLFFGGTVGKSAQFPLHVWLPDAVTSSSPVSAIATTMTSAGVFLLMRAFPIFQAADFSAWAIRGIPLLGLFGAVTALGASFIAVAQHDIKRVLAYATISQMGYVVAALGIDAYAAGVFHLITYAFFNALLCLSAGSVIHGLERGHHHIPGNEDESTEARESAQDKTWPNPNDMRNLGGLRRRMPRTFWAFLIGGLALAGIPITTGFWSKHEILAQAYTLSRPLFWMLAVATGITAFYTARQLCMTFAGQPRTGAIEHAHESAPVMTWPLIILAVFAFSLGWAGIPEHFPVIGGLIPNWFHDFVGSALDARAAGEFADHLQFPLIMGLAFAFGGLLVGWLVYGLKPMQASEMDRLETGMRQVYLGWLHTWLRNDLYIDQAYQKVFVNGSIWLANLLDRFDYGPEQGTYGVLDGLVNGVGAAGRALSSAAGWLDTHIVDGTVNRIGLLVRALSDAAGRRDVDAVDATVNRIGAVGRQASVGSHAFDRYVIDGTVNGIGKVVKIFGGWMRRRLQPGQVQTHLLIAIATTLALAIAFFIFFVLNI